MLSKMLYILTRTDFKYHESGNGETGIIICIVIGLAFLIDWLLDGKDKNKKNK